MVGEDNNIFNSFEDFEENEDVKAPASLKNDVIGGVEKSKNLLEFVSIYVGRLGDMMTAALVFLFGQEEEGDKNSDDHTDA